MTPALTGMPGLSAVPRSIAVAVAVLMASTALGLGGVVQVAGTSVSNLWRSLTTTPPQSRRAAPVDSPAGR